MHGLRRVSGDAAADAHSDRFRPRRGQEPEDQTGPGMRAVWKLRLQGARRPLRGPALLRRDPRDDPDGLDDDRVETQGGRGGDGQPALLGAPEDPRWGHDPGRSAEGDGPLINWRVIGG